MNDNGAWARAWSSCNWRRSVYQTCDEYLYGAPDGAAIYRDETHGQNACNTFLRATCHYCRQARGSNAIYY